MSELERILDRIKPEKLAFYALYGTKWSDDYVRSYDTVLEDAYEAFLEYLKGLYPSADMTGLDDKLSRFIFTYSELYLEIGMVAGYALNKELESKFHFFGLDAALDHIADPDRKTT